MRPHMVALHIHITEDFWRYMDVIEAADMFVQQGEKEEKRKKEKEQERRKMPDDRRGMKKKPRS